MSDNEYQSIDIDIPQPDPIPAELCELIGQMMLDRMTAAARQAGAFEETDNVCLVDRPEYRNFHPLPKTLRLRT